jgi:hypothetical protein
MRLAVKKSKSPESRRLCNKISCRRKLRPNVASERKRQDKGAGEIAASCQTHHLFNKNKVSLSGRFRIGRNCLESPTKVAQIGPVLDVAIWRITQYYIEPVAL